MHITRVRLAALLLPFVLGASAGAQKAPKAQKAPSDPCEKEVPKKDRWEFALIPYFWAAGLHGTVGVANHEASISESFSDIFDDLNFAAMGALAARKGDWGISADLFWVALGQSVDRPAGHVDIGQGMFALYGMRRVAPGVDVMLGARLNSIHNDVEIDALRRDFNKTRRWVDPLIGVNVRYPFAKAWHAGLYGEVGGFDIGSNRLAWQAYPSVGISLNRTTSIDLGYRWIGNDYETGEGLEQFKYDVVMHGIVLAAAFRF
jgi:hypothetical protein